MTLPARYAMFFAMVIGLIVTACSPQEPQAGGPLKERVLKFLRMPSLAGVQAEEARRLGKEAVPLLERHLENSEEKSYHPRAVVALGLLGDLDAKSSLMKYMDSTRGTVDSSSFEALLNAPMALGHLAARSDTALRFLLSRADLDFWAGRTKYEEAEGDEGVFIVRAIMNGLGISGRPEALAKLKALRNIELLRECAEDNIELNMRVAQAGEEEKLPREIPKIICEGYRPASSDVPEGREVVQPLTMVRHAAISVDPQEVTQILEDASKRLHDKDRETDVGCSVKFEFMGTIEPFGNLEDKDQVVTCSSQLRRVLCLPDARIKLVKRISGHDLCETQGEGTFSGCAEEPGKNILLVSSVKSGAIWAHEFGHNQGLGHREDSLRAIMHPTASGTDEVNEQECRGFRRPQ